MDDRTNTLAGSSSHVDRSPDTLVAAATTNICHGVIDIFIGGLRYAF